MARQKYQWGIVGAGLVATIVLAVHHRMPAADDKPAPEKPKAEKPAPDPVALAEGQALFRGLCSGCHGGAGRGGKGPDLTRKHFIHGDTDDDIKRTIRNGVPKTTMKKLGDSLKEEQIANLLVYIRSLARQPGEATWKPYLAGDPKVGRKIFFDEKSKLQCAKCHTIGGEGGRVGPGPHASRRLRVHHGIDRAASAISTRNTRACHHRTAIVGMRVNETNFSIRPRGEWPFSLVRQADLKKSPCSRNRSCRECCRGADRQGTARSVCLPDDAGIKW